MATLKSSIAPVCTHTHTHTHTSPVSYEEIQLHTCHLGATRAGREAAWADTCVCVCVRVCGTYP